MVHYKLSNAAADDLIRIHQYGVHEHGEMLADQYYYRLIERFEKITQNPYLYPPVDFIKAGYRRSVCGADSIYYHMVDGIVEIMAILGSQHTETSL